MTESNMGIQVFAGELLDAVVQALGPGWKAAPNASELAEGERFCVRLELQGGNAWVVLEAARAAALAARIPGKAASESGAAETEALVNTFTAAGEALVQKYGAVRVEASESAAAEDATVLHFALADEAGESFVLRVAADAALMETLGETKSAAAADAEKALIAEQVNLELVLDVELNVTLRFGQRMMTLREVLDLTSGSVVELDRQVEEPVELLLEGKVIARGEAVVIDGNYGLRVTDVPQPISPAMLGQR